MFWRSLLLLLVCLNAATAAWWWWRPPVPAESVAMTLPDVPPLTLLSERDSERLPQTAELAAAPTLASATPVCLSLGPFDTPSALRAAAERLSAGVGKLQYREAQVQATQGWRVFLPAASSRAAALSQARELAAKGLRDYYVVTAGPAENTVSLGLFRDEANARARREELAAQGIEATVEEASEERPQWRLEIAVATDYDWRAAIGPGNWQASPIPCF